MFSRWIVTNITSASVTTFLAFIAGIISWSVYCVRHTINNSSRFLKVNRGIEDAMACYRQIYEDNKKVIVQSSLDVFVRKAERPASSTSPQPSTSFSEPE
jgi:hypothetical protein